MIARVRAWCLAAVASTILLTQVVIPTEAPIGLAASVFVVPAQAMDDEDVDPSVEQSALDTLAGDLAAGIRQLAKQVYWSFTRVAVRWARWLRRLLPFLPIVVIAGLADRGLLQAWRSQGIRVLVTYVPLMLYVYLRLLVTAKVRLMGKVALGAALAYGLVRHDLITDRLPIPGYLDDAVIIIAATRLFLYTCPENLVSSFAAAAINWRRRMAALQRARQR